MLSSDALAVLAGVKTGPRPDGFALVIPEQLDRPLYEEVNEVLRRLGGKWKRGAGHLFTWDPAPLIAQVVASGEMPPNNPNAYHPTPPAIVAQVLDALDADGIGVVSILEPSAGTGALALAALERFGVVPDCCEVDPLLRGVLESHGLPVVASDFLTFQPAELYDVVVMNPPFSVAGDPMAWETHLRRAWSMVRLGGRLACVTPAGWPVIGTSKRHEDARLFVSRTFDIVPVDGRFDTTNIDTLIVSGAKMAEQWRDEEYNGWPSWAAFNAGLILTNDSQTQQASYKAARAGLEAFKEHARGHALHAWKEYGTVWALTDADALALWRFMLGEDEDSEPVIVGQGDLFAGVA